MKTSRIYAVAAVLSIVVAAVPVAYPGLDLAVAHYFLQVPAPVKPGDWWWVNWINEYTPTVFRSLAVASLLMWWITDRNTRWKAWAVPAAFVGLALVIGPGLLVSSAKEITLRARPFHVTEFAGTQQFSPALTIVNQCSDNCAFVSGHTADGFFLASLMLIFPRRRWWWLTAGVLSGVVIGFARISVGALWLSDALWAFPITLLGSWLVYVAFLRLGWLKAGSE